MLTNITGLSENQIAPYLAKIYTEGQALVITTNMRRAQKIATDLAFFCDAKVFVLPDFDMADFKYEAKSRNDLQDYLNAYSALLSGQDCIVVAPVLSALKQLQPRKVFVENTFAINLDATVNREEVIRCLTLLGYDRVPLAQAPGQFSARGDIIDIFSPCNENPVRIELFDDEVDSIRSFDPLTQRSIDTLDEIDVFPAQLVTLDPNVPEIAAAVDDGMNPQLLEHYVHSFYSSCDLIWNYARNLAVVAIDDPSRIAETLDLFESELSESESDEIDKKSYPRPDDLLKVNDLPSKLGTYYFTPFAQQIRFTETLNVLESVKVNQPPICSGHMDVLETSLRRYIKNGYRVVIACGSSERCANLEDFISRSGITGNIELSEGVLSTGYDFPEDKVLYLSEAEIFRSAKKTRKRHSKGQKIKAFTDIVKGDYIVHEAHGVGQFTGVERLTVDGSTRDYLKIQYAGADALYVPVDQMETIQKYVGSEGVVPKVSKLSGTDWQQTKLKAKESIKEMAEEFIKAAAEREKAKGFAFGPDSAWQKEFEDAFVYEETSDQLRCAEEIKTDMQKERAMDRLLCGDVGYGKTEVASRAIFKALEQGKQVAVLVPTTILASQHYHTFLERFSGFPFNIDMLCRFRTAAQQDKTVEALKEGKVDLIVGTHRLLSKDVEFKDLGLLVVDEEQRFGVEHKEAIKRLKTNVDVLTLSATPIPRTLHMSLIGVRDMSVIEEPPEERYPVQTYVMEQDDRVIAEAIRREMGRGGQVYLVYNRVKSINQQARRIRELVPEARIAIAHGQMNEVELEDVMLDFQGGGADVLIVTTIIESGLDIPNVNTMIVLDADRFGLSQLYQLRGRVGRSNRMAYAYLMYKKDKVLTELAEKRLRAIKEFTEFGSGFRVAMRDLELRGAGNLLGVEQSGHMLSIGYELYCKLVDEAVAELKGVPQEAIPLDADTAVELGVSAYLPEEYVADELTRLDLYKRISSILTDDDRMEIYDELIDRFGDPPQEADNLLDVAMIRNRASRLGISKVVKQLNKVVFTFEERNALDAEAVSKLYGMYGPAITVYGGVEPRVTIVFNKTTATNAAMKLLSVFGEVLPKE
ncbi:MAG: transcription-repair coupling factor [Clostridia bacterium]|nr:transcription-repair coupling factor [Clostridia bacterium]